MKNSSRGLGGLALGFSLPPFMLSFFLLLFLLDGNLEKRKAGIEQEFSLERYFSELRKNMWDFIKNVLGIFREV